TLCRVPMMLVTLFPVSPLAIELAAELVHAGDVDFAQGERAEGGNEVTPDGALVVQPGRGMQVGVLDDRAVAAKGRPESLPAEEVALERHEPVGPGVGMEDVEPGAPWEKGTVVEIAPADRGVDQPHRVLAPAAVLWRIEQARVLLGSDALPGEVES